MQSTKIDKFRTYQIHVAGKMIHFLVFMTSMKKGRELTRTYRDSVTDIDDDDNEDENDNKLESRAGETYKQLSETEISARPRRNLYLR